MSIRTSEWVSAGHPDKIADNISSYILDRYMEQDPNTRYALEVMVKNNDVILGGEITSTVKFDDLDYRYFVKEALKNIGYDYNYYKKWGKNAICSEFINVQTFITQQSLDISKGVDSEGWGDQGIFFGYAENTVEHMPVDHNIAKTLGKYLYTRAKVFQEGGLDIKTQITYDDDYNKIIKAIVAIPCMSKEEYDTIYNNILSWFRELEAFNINEMKLIVNGTGSYITHSSIGDCGITGRKLAVDFYGGNCKIGGGSPWTKDPSKADLTLNIFMRMLAVKELDRKVTDTPELYKVVTNTNSCIGHNDLVVTYTGYDKDDNILYVNHIRNDLKASEIIQKLNLRKPIYSDLCMNGLFSKI